MPVDPTQLPDPENTESLLTLAQENVRRGRAKEQELYEIRNPETGERAHVTRQNMRDRVRIDGWTVVPKNEGPPKPEPIQSTVDPDPVEEQISAPREPTELDKLREEYEALTGRAADKRWGKKALQDKIDLASDD